MPSHAEIPFGRPLVSCGSLEDCGLTLLWFCHHKNMLDNFYIWHIMIRIFQKFLKPTQSVKYEMFVFYWVQIWYFEQYWSRDSKERPFIKFWYDCKFLSVLQKLCSLKIFSISVFSGLLSPCPHNLVLAHLTGQQQLRGSLG